MEANQIAVMTGSTKSPFHTLQKSGSQKAHASEYDVSV